MQNSSLLRCRWGFDGVVGQFNGKSYLPGRYGPFRWLPVSISGIWPSLYAEPLLFSW